MTAAAKMLDVANHPNRSKRNPSLEANPTPAQIVAARQAAELTQAAAATKIDGSVRAWEKWEAGERRMHPGLFELFLIKTGQPKPGR